MKNKRQMPVFNEEELYFECWADVPGWEGFYQISNLGRVKSCDRYVVDSLGRKRHRKEQILKGGTGGGNTTVVTWGKYRTIAFDAKGRKKETYLLHRLVAKIFIPNPYNLPEVEHIDGDPFNCRASNLLWISREDNIALQHHRGRTLQYDNGYRGHCKKFIEDKYNELVDELNWLEENGYHSTAKESIISDAAYQKHCEVAMKNLIKRAEKVLPEAYFEEFCKLF